MRGIPGGEGTYSGLWQRHGLKGKGLHALFLESRLLHFEVQAIAELLLHFGGNIFTLARVVWLDVGVGVCEFDGSDFFVGVIIEADAGLGVNGRHSGRRGLVSEVDGCETRRRGSERWKKREGGVGGTVEAV